MTIKPKKKTTKDKNDQETSDGLSHGQGHAVPSHLSHNHSHYHHANVTESRLDLQTRGRNSPPRWLPSTSSRDDVSHSSLNQGLASTTPYEYESVDTTSKNKRRHRSSPHRTIRKHRNHAPTTVNIVPVASGSSIATNHEVDVCDDEDYNSGDEHSEPPALPDNVLELEQSFEHALKEKKGFVLKKMGEDGACLFRAVADQVYGDQEMHGVARKLCLDYMAKNADFYSQYVTEDFTTYINRKRMDSCHGNHLEIQAMTELFNRPVEVYQYSLEPMNTFDTAYKTDNPPIRLSYHGSVHYNSIVDPYAASIGVGLGLPEYKPGQAERNQMKDAKKHSENFHIEQTMLADKIRETDWEVTQDSIEEQVARESYLQWLREQEKCSRRTNGKVRTAASATCSSSGEGSQLNPLETGPIRSPRQLRSGNNSPMHPEEHSISVPGSSKSPRLSPPHSMTQVTGTGAPSAAALGEASATIEHLQPDFYGMSDWGEEDILAQVMAQSQQEYLESLKQRATMSFSPSHHHPSTSAASSSTELPLPGYSGGGATTSTAGQGCHYSNKNSGSGHHS